jgi:hypothetical protein
MGVHVEFRFLREGIQNRNRLLDFGGKEFKIEIDSSILAGSDELHSDRISFTKIGTRLGQNYKANMAKLQSELQNMPLQGFHT